MRPEQKPPSSERLAEVAGYKSRYASRCCASVSKCSDHNQNKRQQHNGSDQEDGRTAGRDHIEQQQPKSGHLFHRSVLEQSRQAEYDLLTALPLAGPDYLGKLSGRRSLRARHESATKLAY
jgi:hypothetical protein